MRTKPALLLGAALLAAAGLAALDQPKAKEAKGGCCAPKGDTKAAASEPLRCTLTGKTVESCCCTEKDGKLYCPLAKKTIESCCCVPANADKAKSEAADEEPLRCGPAEKKDAGTCCAHAGKKDQDQKDQEEKQ